MRNGLLVLGFVIACTACPLPALAQTAGITGDWKGSGGDVRVGPCPSSQDLCATVLTKASPDAMSSRVGDIAVHDMKPDKPGVWLGSVDSQAGRLPATVTLKDDGHAELSICPEAGKPCQTEEFTRLPAP